MERFEDFKAHCTVCNQKVYYDVEEKKLVCSKDGEPIDRRCYELIDSKFAELHSLE